MKKIIILLVAFLPILAHGENMCVKNGSVMVVLDPQINGTALANDATGKTWSTQFPYGIISGVIGCYSNVGNVQGAVASNQNITPYNTVAHYCYCKMLRPIESLWVSTGSLQTPSGTFPGGCPANCASKCSSSVASAVALRAGLFGNVIE